MGAAASSIPIIYPDIQTGTPAVFFFPCDAHTLSEQPGGFGLQHYAADPTMAFLNARQQGMELAPGQLAEFAGIGEASDRDASIAPGEHAAPESDEGRNPSGLRVGPAPSGLAFLGAANKLVTDSQRKVGARAELSLLTCGRKAQEATSSTLKAVCAALQKTRAEQKDYAAASALILAGKRMRLLREPDTWLDLLKGTACRVPLSRFCTAHPQLQPHRVRDVLGLFRQVDLHRRGRVGINDLDILVSAESDGAGDSVAFRYLFELHPITQAPGFFNPFEFVGWVDAVCVLTEGELIVGLWEWLNGYVRKCSLLGLLSTAEPRKATRSRDSAAKQARQRIVAKKERALAREKQAKGATVAPAEPPTQAPAKPAVREAELKVTGGSDVILPQPEAELVLDPWQLLSRNAELVEAARRHTHPDRALLLQIVRLAVAAKDTGEPMSDVSFTDFASVLELTDQAFYMLSLVHRWLKRKTGGDKVWLARRLERQVSLRKARSRLVAFAKPTAPLKAKPRRKPSKTPDEWAAAFRLPDIRQLLAEEASSRRGSRAVSRAGSFHGTRSKTPMTGYGAGGTASVATASDALTTTRDRMAEVDEAVELMEAQASRSRRATDGTGVTSARVTLRRVDTGLRERGVQKLVAVRVPARDPAGTATAAQATSPVRTRRPIIRRTGRGGVDGDTGQPLRLAAHGT
jgi:hypothetical protein